MAFSLSDWYASKFKKGVEKSAESVKEAAEAILASEGTVGVGQKSQFDWARTALSKLEDEDVESAYQWVTGAKQAHKAKRVYEKYLKTQEDISSKAQSLQAGIANILDFSSGELTETEKMKLTAKAAAKQAKLDELGSIASLLGVDTTAALTKTSAGTYIPTADLTSTAAARATTRRSKQLAAAERQAAIERAAGIATNVAGGSAATSENVASFAPTTVDNVIDARAFAEETPSVEVGGTPNLQAGTASPVFVGDDGISLYYIPSGTNQPTRISDPSQLQQLAAAGMVEVGGQYRPLSSAGEYLASKASAASAGAETGGAYGQLAGQLQESLQPYRDAITSMQESILGFERADYEATRETAEARYGIDDIMDQLSTVDSQIADLLDIADRVPETTLEAARGTEVTQSVLDRQRTNLLSEISRTASPLTRLKAVLEDDYERRSSLVDDAVEIQKEADSYKLQRLGYALDFAVQNFTMAEDQAQSLFDAATKDYEYQLSLYEQSVKDQKAALEAQNEAIKDFYEAQGYVIDPETGELAETLALKNYRKSRSNDGTSISQATIDYIEEGLTLSKGKDGYANTKTYSDFYAQVAAQFGSAAAKEFLSRFPATAYLNPKDPTAVVYFGTKPSSSAFSSDLDLESLINEAAGVTR